MNDEQPKRMRGRPRDPAKRAALLAAARTLFLELGVDAVTLDQVIATAGVSRATLYSNFADKRALLAAVVTVESERIISDVKASELIATDIRTALIDYGDNLIRFISDPETVAFERLIERLTKAEPTVGSAYFAAGPGRVRDILAHMIAAAQRRGELRHAHAEQAANDLMGLWEGFWRIEVAFGLRGVPDEKEQNRLARHGVEHFMRLYGQ